MDMETLFRLEREELENEARRKIASLLQSQARGRLTRKRVKAMKKVGASISNLKHIRNCRKIVKLLVSKRNDGAVIIQKEVRRWYCSR